MAVPVPAADAASMIRPLAVALALSAVTAASWAAERPHWLKTERYAATFAIRGAVRCAPACDGEEIDVRLVDRGGLDNSRSTRRDEFAHVNLRAGATFRFFATHQWERDEVRGESPAALVSILATVDRVGCETTEREIRFNPIVPADGMIRLNVGTLLLDCAQRP